MSFLIVKFLKSVDICPWKDPAKSMWTQFHENECHSHECLGVRVKFCCYNWQLIYAFDIFSIGIHLWPPHNYELTFSSSLFQHVICAIKKELVDVPFLEELLWSPKGCSLYIHDSFPLILVLLLLFSASRIE